MIYTVELTDEEIRRVHEAEVHGVNSPSVQVAVKWYEDLLAAGCRIYVPAIADYEVRRELIRAGKLAGIAGLDAFLLEEPDRYLPLTDAALKRAAGMWAAVRNAGQPTADAKELDCRFKYANGRPRTYHYE